MKGAYRADTSNGRDAVFVGCLVELEALYTSTNLESRAAVRSTPVVGHVLNILQIVSPKRKSIFSGGPSIVVMASVLDNQAKVERSCEVDGQLDLSYILHMDRVGGVTALSTVTKLRRVGALQTSWSLIERKHDRAMVVGAVSVRGPSTRIETMHTEFCQLPKHRI